jgi:5-formyltetrahydrofolate cyclo-ligase
VTEAPADQRLADEAPAEDPAVSAAKRALRADVRRRRAERPAELRRVDDATRSQRLIDWLVAVRPSCVAAYLSTGTEPDTLAVLEWLAGEPVRVLLPASTDGAWGAPAWAEYLGADQLRMGPLQIAEPTGGRLPAETIGDADVVLCPGLAGSTSGKRLGRGGGWYDRVLPLKGASASLMLLLNDDEVVDDLPTGLLDRRVDTIVTQTRRWDCSSAG